MKAKAWILASLIAGLASANEMAVSASGKKILLRDDGTWEVFDPERHVDVSDVRAQGVQVEIVIKYKDREWCLKEKRMMLEAEGLGEVIIKDSLKTVPKAGVLVLQAPERSIDPAHPRRYEYTVLDGKGKSVLKRLGGEMDARPSDQAGLVDLMELSIDKVVAGPLTVQVKNLANGQLFEYEVPLK